MCSYSGISAHSYYGLIGYIFLISSYWWLDCDVNRIFRWFLRRLYMFCRCLVVDAEVNVGIWYYWLLPFLFCYLELVRRFLWGLLFVDTISIPIHYCDIDVSNRTTTAVCEDKLIWFIAGYIVDAG